MKPLQNYLVNGEPMHWLRYWLLTRTGVFYSDGTFEVRVSLARRWWAVLAHWFLCLAAAHPHLVTATPAGQVWFRRWWLLKLPLLCLYVHNYPHGTKEPEAFGLHCHPRHTFSWIWQGGYCHHVVKADGRRSSPRVGWAVRTDGTRTWWLSWKDAHRVLWMLPQTWSLFGMVGRWHGWRFPGGETTGSSRLLKQEVA